MSDTPNVFIEHSGSSGSFHTYAEIAPVSQVDLWNALTSVPGTVDIPEMSILVEEALRDTRTGNPPRNLRAYSTGEVELAHRVADVNDLSALLALMKAIEAFHPYSTARLVVWVE